MQTIVTGGAGFIGSHITDVLIARGHEVTIIDNLISGDKKNINPKAKFIRLDIRNRKVASFFDGAEIIFHMAASPEVRTSAIDPTESYDNNVNGTFNLLEACRKKDVKHVVFASTSTVYGEAALIPTPEEYICEPISNYGASKLACEAYLSSYAHTYGIKCTALRYANIYGERSKHGVMYDFYNKLKKNPKRLEILGNGKQEKSYLHVFDCVSATILAAQKQQKIYDVFNVGSKEKQTVDYIAKVMSSCIELHPKFEYTGLDRGWKGDVRTMLLDIDKINKLGWKPSISLEEGIRRYVTWLGRENAW